MWSKGRILVLHHHGEYVTAYLVTVPCFSKGAPDREGPGKQEDVTELPDGRHGKEEFAGVSGKGEKFVMEVEGLRAVAVGVHCDADRSYFASVGRTSAVGVHERELAGFAP